MSNLNSYNKVSDVFVGQPFGNGLDGNKTVSGTEQINTYKSCSGTSGNAYVTVGAGDEASFSAGDLVAVHKSRGDTTTNCGVWEFKRVASTVSGQVNFTSNLNNSYQDSGDDQSQIILVPRYDEFTCSGGNTINATDWNENLGGLVIVVAKTSVTLAGTVETNDAGFRNDGQVQGADTAGYQGEGTAGAGAVATTANGNAGGGGGRAGGAGSRPGGGGGGLGTAGSKANDGDGCVGGAGGAVDGNDYLTELCFGGEGGGGGSRYAGNTGNGGNGAGAIIIISKTITISGAVNSNGANGSAASGTDAGGGGGGSGGSIMLQGQDVTMGTDLISATGGSGGAGSSGGTAGGAAGDGRIAVYYKDSLSGSVGASYYGTYHSETDDDLEETAMAGAFLVL